MRREGIAILLALLLASGCSSRPAIPVNQQQTLVMESSLLAAGITAEKPTLSDASALTTATSELYNDNSKPVTVNYRFYWYDTNGLEMHPLEHSRSVVIPAKSGVKVTTSTRMPGAAQVRLYLYL
ncbi:YcfL family protein [Entomohabitans teleogrylli]|uniref:YcfL family protein n=1 Tax=Entomohabitans teleogrylli TaxID=1384589 RepID=UPI00073D524A|nr:DUF1425 domain-containing protein [Entomohabitans teleogrylli]